MTNHCILFDQQISDQGGLNFNANDLTSALPDSELTLAQSTALQSLSSGADLTHTLTHGGDLAQSAGLQLPATSDLSQNPELQQVLGNEADLVQVADMQSLSADTELTQSTITLVTSEGQDALALASSAVQSGLTLAPSGGPSGLTLVTSGGGGGADGTGLTQVSLNPAQDTLQDALTVDLSQQVMPSYGCRDDGEEDLSI